MYFIIWSNRKKVYTVNGTSTRSQHATQALIYTGARARCHALGTRSDVLELSRVAQVVTSPRLVVPVRLREGGATRRRGGHLWPPGGAGRRRVVAGVEPAVDVLVRWRAIEAAEEEEDDDGDGELVSGAGHDVDLEAGVYEGLVYMHGYMPYMPCTHTYHTYM